MQTQPANANLAQTESGLIVPAGLVNDRKATGIGVARDLDGRRRLVYTANERKLIHRMQEMLKVTGLAQVMICFGSHGAPDHNGKPTVGNGYHLDGSKACEQVMKVEGADGHDCGYGCNCTRVHFIQ